MTPLLLTVLVLGAGDAHEKPIRPLPTLSREPKLDGNLKDFRPAQTLKMPESAKGPSSSLEVRAAYRKGALYLAVEVRDTVVTADDLLDVSLFFPGSGTTAQGHIIRFNKDGAVSAPPELAPPAWALKLVQAGAAPDKKEGGFDLEAMIPARALPRFQANEPLALDLCVEYQDVDEDDAEKHTLTTCPNQEMVGGPIRLPDDLRKQLKPPPPENVEGVEARETGWVGYSRLHYPTWALSDEPLSAEALIQLVAGDASIDPKTVALPIPHELYLPDTRAVYTVLTGKSPYQGEKCVDAAELRMAMYVVTGKVAHRVLEWPAATCKLGRAMRFELSEDGNLTIGYTNGSTAHFTWSTDHFERSELGLAE